MPKSFNRITQNFSDPENSFGLSKEYKFFLDQLKNKIRSSRLKAALMVNQEVISAYWHIGKKIIEH